MRRGDLVRWGLVTAVLVVVAGGAELALATTAVWKDYANGQGFDCDGLPGDDYFWPDNNYWSQAQVIGTDPCGNPGKTLEPSNWNGPDYPDNQGGFAHWDVTLGAPANTVLDVTTEIDTLDVTSAGHLDMLGGTALYVKDSSLVNDGTIVVNSDASASTSILSLFSPTNTGLLSGSGEILLNQGGGAAQFHAGGSQTTQAAGHAIRGKGRLVAWLTNNGLVEAADTSGGGDPVLVVELTDQTNNNIFRATTGATLRIESIKLTQDQATGRLIGDGPGGVSRGNVELGDGAYIAGGRLEGQVDIADGTVTLEDVTNTSNDTNSVPGTTTVIRGPSFTNNGTFSVTSPIYNQFTYLNFATDTLLTGSGELYLGQFNAVRVSADAGVTVTNDAGHTIAGEGKWSAPLVNNGMVSGRSITFENTTIENNATMTTQQYGGFSVLGSTLTQDPTGGVLLAGPGGTINLTNSTITNGVLRSTFSGGSFSGFYASGAHLVNVRNEARINIHYSNTLTIEGTTFLNDGPITVNNDHVTSATTLSFTDSVLVDGSGNIKLNEHGTAALLTVVGGGVLTQAATHTIDGTGQINAQTFVNHGTVTGIGIINSDVENDGPMTSLGEINGDVVNQGTLGGTFASSLLEVNGTLTGTGLLEFIQINGTHAPGNGGPAQVDVGGLYAVSSTGTLAVELGGTTPGTEFDVIHVVSAGATSGAMLLDGTLSVELVDTGSGVFMPSVGDTFPILLGGTLTGTFATENLPNAAGGRGLSWQVLYGSGVTLKLTYALTGDYNGNGVVDAADYTVWRDTLGQTSGSLAADGDGDGQIDDDDYNVWKSQFGQLAPGAGAGSLAGAQVPEPASAVLLLAAMGVGLAARRAAKRHLC